ncbi:MAG: hypothetical protein LBE38_08880 [Deltaproteobacteria bacterium]|jgi:hypothetical protein|nr:hypothetical protein [Deltaproteobacteria bacterium]
MDEGFRHSRAFDRIWRLVALFVLCGLVYYFSFDNGRQTSKAQMQRLMADNDSLRTQLELQSKEIDDLRRQRNQFQEELARSESAAYEAQEPPEASPGASAIDAQSTGENALEITRLQLRSDENKLILDSQVLLSLGNIDIADESVLVRIHYLDTDRRETRTMEGGDSFMITRGEASYRLILDKLTGTLATFLLISS